MPEPDPDTAVRELRVRQREVFAARKEHLARQLEERFMFPADLIVELIEAVVDLKLLDR